MVIGQIQHIQDEDIRFVRDRMEKIPDSASAARFCPGDGIEKLSLAFDIDCLRQALNQCLENTELLGDE